jgi:hypothetical protein
MKRPSTECEWTQFGRSTNFRALGRATKTVRDRPTIGNALAGPQLEQEMPDETRPARNRCGIGASASGKGERPIARRASRALVVVWAVAAATSRAHANGVGGDLYCPFGYYFDPTCALCIPDGYVYVPSYAYLVPSRSYAFMQWRRHRHDDDRDRDGERDYRDEHRGHHERRYQPR